MLRLKVKFSQCTEPLPWSYSHGKIWSERKDAGSVVRWGICVLHLNHSNKSKENSTKLRCLIKAAKEGQNRIGTREEEQSDERSVLYIGRGVCNFSGAPESKLSAWYNSGSRSLMGRHEAEQAWPFFGHTAHWSVYHSFPGVILSSSEWDLKISPARSFKKGSTWTTCQHWHDIRGSTSGVQTALQYSGNTSIVDVCTELHQQGYGERKRQPAALPSAI